jgi:putative PIN family toxin of toxin-antitoxin system
VPPSVVLDTSVLIAGLRSPRGASFEVLRRLGGSEFEICLSVPLVLEYEAVAKRQARELGLSLGQIDDVLDYLCGVGSHHQIFYLWRPFLRDPSDDMVLEVAVEAGAEYIVTHNLRDFAGVEEFGIEAITPAQLLQRLGL